ncbi:MAG: hypothetical protein ACI4VL_05390 [Bacilli bacterium]
MGTDSGGTNVGKINLNGTDNGNSFALISGGTNISVTGAASSITINHATPTMDTNTAGTATTLSNGGKFNAITEITKDS